VPLLRSYEPWFVLLTCHLTNSIDGIGLWEPYMRRSIVRRWTAFVDPQHQVEHTCVAGQSEHPATSAALNPCLGSTPEGEGRGQGLSGISPPKGRKGGLRPTFRWGLRRFRHFPTF
jgi:hypothetical protein